MSSDLPAVISEEIVGARSVSQIGKGGPAADGFLRKSSLPNVRRRPNSRDVIKKQLIRITGSLQHELRIDYIQPAAESEADLFEMCDWFDAQALLKRQTCGLIRRSTTDQRVMARGSGPGTEIKEQCLADTAAIFPLVLPSLTCARRRRISDV